MGFFNGRLAIQQRVLPSYRTPFFKLLAQSCSGGLGIFAGKPTAAENISTATQINNVQLVPANNWHIMNINSALYQCWQPGIIHWIKHWQPDALIVEANPRYPSNRSAVRWMRSRGRPVLGWGLGAAPISGVFSKPVLNLPEFKNFTVLSQRQSKEYSLEGKNIKTNMKMVYELFASRPGVFVIKPVTLKDSNRTYKGPPIKIKVKGKPLKDKRKISPYILEGTDL